MITPKTIANDEEYLRQVSIPIDFNQDPIEQYAKELKEYCIKANLYALASIQIGIPKRMIYIRNTNEDMSKNEDKDYSEDQFMINPVIRSKKGKTRFLEGCGSCLDYVAVVERPYKVEVEYLDLQGISHKEIIEGFGATVFCHEYDHLDGILHMDRSQEVYRMNRDEMRAYRLNHPYQIIEKDA